MCRYTASDRVPPKALQPTPRPTESQVAKAIPRGLRLTADR